MEDTQKRDKPPVIVGSLVKVDNISEDYAPGTDIFLGRIGQVVRMKWGRAHIEFDDESEGIFKVEDLSPV